MPLYTSYSEETQTLIEEFLENTWNWDEDQLVDFVERFGEEKFKTDFEEYASMVDDIGIDIVEAYQQDSAIAIGDSGDTDRLTAGEIWGTVAGTRHTYEIDYQYASETDVIATITMIISFNRGLKL